MAMNEQNSGNVHMAVPTGNPKAPFETKFFSDVGTGHPFVSRVWLGLNEVIDAALITNHKEIKEAIGGLMIDCLIPAFVSLRELRKLWGDKKVPELTKTKHFNDMYGSLWTAYKDRTQKVVKLLGFKIGFLYDNDQKFKDGCTEFATVNPKVDSNFCPLLKWHRDHWQNELAKFRNNWLEHQTLQPKDVAKFYMLDTAEFMFECVWLAIEDIVGFLAGAKMPPSIVLTELLDARDGGATKRFGFMLAEGVKLEDSK